MRKIQETGCNQASKWRTVTTIFMPTFKWSTLRRITLTWIIFNPCLIRKYGKVSMMCIFSQKIKSNVIDGTLVFRTFRLCTLWLASGLSIFHRSIGGHCRMKKKKQTVRTLPTFSWNIQLMLIWKQKRKKIQDQVKICYLIV